MKSALRHLTLATLETVMLTVLLLITLQFLGWIVFVKTPPTFDRILQAIWEWVHGWLFVFAATALLYIRSLLALNDRLREGAPIYEIRELDTRTDLWTSTFINIGVIATACGMISALQLALGNITQEIVDVLGPWGVLKLLTDGGLVMALGTTVVGGAGGQLMKLIKHVWLGRSLERVNAETESKDAEPSLSSTSKPRRSRKRHPRRTQ